MNTDHEQQDAQDLVDEVDSFINAEDAQRRERGRPTVFKEEYVAQGQKLCQLGATDIEIADFFGVTVRTIYRWKHDYPQFCQALKLGKDVADDRVERSLYQKAIGYEQEAVKIFMPAQAVSPVYAPFTEKIAPDTTAAIFWLCNRRKADWQQKNTTEHQMPDLAGALRAARERATGD